MGARVHEASDDLSRLVQDSSSVNRQAAPTTCASATLEVRHVRVQSGGGQRACKVAGHADDLQPSGGRGRVRHRETSGKLVESVRKRVKVRAGKSG